MNLEKRLKDLESEIAQIDDVEYLVPLGYIVCPPELELIYGSGTRPDPAEPPTIISLESIKMILDRVYGTQEDQQ